MSQRLFEGFANVWTPVLPARELRAKPKAVRLAGESVVLYRDGRGGVGAMLDRCPHRGVRLSLGSVNADGNLECPFHGWCFDARGACVHIPFDAGSDGRAKRDRRGATALPAVEAGGLLWVYTGRDAEAQPVVPDALTQPGWSRWLIYQDWKCHWTRAMENMLDVPHVPFVHRRTIGREQRARMKRDSVMAIDFEETATGFRIRAQLDDKRGSSVIDWLRPNGMVLRLMPGAPPERGFRQHVFCVPLDASTTRMLVVSTRTFLRYNPLGWLGDQWNRAILLEDRAIVESSQPREVPHPSEEASVATDTPTLHFRRYYLHDLANAADVSASVPAERLVRRTTAG
jgi:phenylpropionate dioxygenase-like ring-hydroxylating dioxygenase large terminal subunit